MNDGCASDLRSENVGAGLGTLMLVLGHGWRRSRVREVCSWRC